MSAEQLEQAQPEQQPEVELTSLSSISLEAADAFLNLFDWSAKLKWVLHLQFVRFRSSKLKQQFASVVTSSHNLRYLEVMFWYLLLVKLPIIGFKKQPNRQSLTEDLREQLHEMLSKMYVQLFMSIPPPKEKTTNLLLFFNVFFCLKMYSETFRQEEIEILMTPRFIMDCFHVVIFQALGMEVSDRYIELNIHELFVDFFQSVTAEYLKKKRSKEEATKKEKRLKADNQTDFFEGKIQKVIPATFEQILFLKQLKEFMSVETQVGKKRSNSLVRKRSLLRRESKSTLMANTKSSFNTNNELKKAENAALQKLKLEQQRAIEEERRKLEFINNLEKIQTSRSSQNLARQSNLKQTLSLTKVGPCVSSFLNLQANRLPGSKLKYINHPEEKVITNDYLRRLLQESKNKDEEPVEELPPQQEQCDISKPMKGMTLMQIASYRLISDRQRDRELQPRTGPVISEKSPLNPETESSTNTGVKLPRIGPAKSFRYRRPEVVLAQTENKRQDIFLSPSVQIAEEDDLEDPRLVRYKNNISKYKRDYRP